MDFLSFMSSLIATYAVYRILLLVNKRREPNPKKLQPGPSGLPIFGNLFALGTNPHITLTELAKIYGPLMTLKLGRVQAVVISSPAMAKEALQKNDLSFSERPIRDVMCALNHHEKSIAWVPMGLKWRTLRKICITQVFSTSRLDATQNLRRNKVKDLVAFVDKSRETGVAVYIGLAAFSTNLNLLSNTIFSMDLCDPSTEQAAEYKKITTRWVDEMGKRNFAASFPVLKRLDVQGIRRRMSVQMKKLMDLFNNIIDQRLQEKRLSGSTEVADVLDPLLGILQGHTEPIDRSDLPTLIADLFIGGTDTTTSSVERAMAELIYNPEKMKKARTELHQIIGKGNTVEESDIPRLPYLQAVVKETLRMHPPAPLIGRTARSDVNLSGFTVPKGARILVNQWGFGKDSNLWENPNSFEPERFLGSDIDVKGHDFELIPFGAGRRMCPAWPLATRMLFLILASLIHKFVWKLEGGVLPKDMNMEEKFGLILKKAQHPRAIPIHF